MVGSGQLPMLCGIRFEGDFTVERRDNIQPRGVPDQLERDLICFQAKEARGGHQTPPFHPAAEGRDDAAPSSRQGLKDPGRQNPAQSLIIPPWLNRAEAAW